MKAKIGKQFDGIMARASRSILGRRRGDSFDIMDAAFLKAAFESAEYYELHMSEARLFSDELKLISHALKLAKPEGLCIEFV